MRIDIGIIVVIIMIVVIVVTFVVCTIIIIIMITIAIITTMMTVTKIGGHHVVIIVIPKDAIFFVTWSPCVRWSQFGRRVLSPRVLLLLLLLLLWRTTTRAEIAGRFVFQLEQCGVGGRGGDGRSSLVVYLGRPPRP